MSQGFGIDAYRSGIARAWDFLNYTFFTILSPSPGLSRWRLMIKGAAFPAPQAYHSKSNSVLFHKILDCALQQSFRQ